MKICIMGGTFAPKVFREVWAQFFEIERKPEDADLVFISWDTEIDQHGNREQDSLIPKIADIYPRCRGPVILTSQVTPGFTRSLGLPIFHMAETLRIKDAKERALYPDYIVLGCEKQDTLPHQIQAFVQPFLERGASLIRCSWEEAEFSKIAVNMTLASQVENANRLSKACRSVGARWERVAEILGHDKRIGRHSYLFPGDWKESKHLLRDYVTLKEIENG